MEELRELVPLFAGMVIAPLFLLALPRGWSERLRFVLILVACLAVGFLASALVGEQSPRRDLPDRLVHLILDMSLVYVGVQIASWFVWKPLLGLLGRRNTDAHTTA